jgi:hypothetical protein
MAVLIDRIRVWFTARLAASPYVRFFANASSHLVKIQISPLRPLHLLHHRKFLIAVLVRDRERCAAVPAQRGVTVLDGTLDVLRIVVHAADDDEVLDPASDEQSAALVQEPEVSGAQPGAAGLVGNARMEGFRRCRLVAPIAARDVGPAYPDLTNPARRNSAMQVRIDNGDVLIDETVSARHQWLRVAGIGCFSCIA